MVPGVRSSVMSVTPSIPASIPLSLSAASFRVAKSSPRTLMLMGMAVGGPPASRRKEIAVGPGVACTSARMDSMISSTLRMPGSSGMSPTMIWPYCSPRKGSIWVYICPA